MQRGWSSGEGPGFVERRAEVRGREGWEQREEGLEDEEQREEGLEDSRKSSDLSSLKPAECGFRGDWKEVETTTKNAQE